MSARPRRFALFLLCAGFILVILGSKLWLINAAGSDLPTWDQWDGEAAVTFLPWLKGELGPAQLFHPHNEHRIVTTKLYLLGLLVANRQWSGFLETTANAMVHACIGLIFWLVTRRWLEPRWWIVFGTLLVLLFSLPFSWENTLVGFQAQFYFLQLFSLLHLWLLLGGEKSFSRWMLGQVCGILALLTMASGFFSALAVLAVVGFRGVRERRLKLPQVATLCCCLAIVGVGWAMRNQVPGHDALKAEGVQQFLTGFLELLVWPGTAAFPFAIVLATPLLVFVVRVLRRPPSGADSVLLGLLVWIVLQFAAIAYARGGNGGPAILSSRYLDLAACNVAVCFLLLLREFSGRTRLLAAGFWSAAVVLGLAQQSRQHWQDFVAPGISRHQYQEENVRAYLATGDSSHLLNQPWGHIPYPEGERLLSILESREIQAIMPPSVRRPVPLADEPVPADLLPRALQLAPVPVAFYSGGRTDNSVAAWKSAQQPPTTLPILRFRIAGDLATNAPSLRLVVKSAEGEVPVELETAPAEHWKPVTIVRCAGPWWVGATDADAHRWFAFTEPVELGYGTWLAEKLLKLHTAVLLSGIVVLSGGALLALLEHRSATQSSSGVKPAVATS